MCPTTRRFPPPSTTTDGTPEADGALWMKDRGVRGAAPTRSSCSWPAPRGSETPQRARPSAAKRWARPAARPKENPSQQTKNHEKNNSGCKETNPLFQLQHARMPPASICRQFMLFTQAAAQAATSTGKGPRYCRVGPSCPHTETCPEPKLPLVSARSDTPTPP